MNLWQPYGLGILISRTFLNQGIGPGKVVLETKYSFLISQGIEGFWNDMNEPANFLFLRGNGSGEETCRRAFTRIKKVRSTFGKCRAS